MSDIFSEIDQTGTISEIEFTRKAVRAIRRTIDDENFESMESEMIFDHIMNAVKRTKFCDYLKRFIYVNEKPEEKFENVSDRFYQECIKTSFELNAAPYSFLESTKKKKSVYIKDWLTKPTVNRKTVFVLGFGLAMTCEQVSYFLTVVLNEDDFDFQNPEEVIFWYCFKHQLSYADCKEFLEKYENTEPSGDRIEASMFEGLPINRYFDLSKEKDLSLYLCKLKDASVKGGKIAAAKSVYENLLFEAKQIIADFRNQESDGKPGTIWTADKITNMDVEDIISSGIPRKNENLQKMSDSRFNQLFEKKHFSRQRIDRMLDGSQKVDRFDIITLQFFIDSQKYLHEQSGDRFRRFLEDVNLRLQEAGMSKFYYVNPYEAFVAMCMMSEFDPLGVFSDGWAISYDSF